MDLLRDFLADLDLRIAAWQIWLLLAVLLALAELMGAQLVLLALGLSCLAGAAVAAFTPWGLAAQLGATVAAAAVLTPLLVLAFRRHHLQAAPGPLDPGWEAGHTARLEGYGGRLGVRIQGDFFPARAESGALPPEGARVVVVRLESVTAVVRPAGDRDIPTEETAP